MPLSLLTMVRTATPPYLKISNIQHGSQVAADIVEIQFIPTICTPVLKEKGLVYGHARFKEKLVVFSDDRRTFTVFSISTSVQVELNRSGGKVTLDTDLSADSKGCDN